MKINQVVNESPQLCPECGGPAFSDLVLAEKQDACYHKVRSRYKVWPSAYASGALVQCRKKGADNWGNKSKNEDVEEGQLDEISANPDYLRAAERSRSQAQATQRTFGKSPEEKAAARRTEINRDKGIAGYTKRHKAAHPEMYPKVKAQPAPKLRDPSTEYSDDYSVWAAGRRDTMEQGVAEGASNIGQQIKSLYQKIYSAGDDAIESMYYDSPIFAQYWDEYEGDLDSIIAEVDASELQVILAELQSAVEDQGLTEASPEATFNALKGLKSWQVVIRNNYYRGKYSDYSGRYYYVLATSPEEAKQVVLDNADAILQDLLSMKSHNGRKILPRGSALRITADRIGEIRDGTEAGRMTTAGFKKMYGPQGPMMVKLSNGAIADVQGQEQSVSEGDPGYDKHSFIGKIRRGREADNKGWGQLGQLFAADNEEDAEKALRKGNRYYNMTRGNNKTPGGFPKTTVEEQGAAEGDISQLEKDIADAPVKPIANMESATDSDGYSVDQEDAGEYDYEGDQAKDQLRTIVAAARKLDGILDDNENMPEWVQMKITKATDYLDTAADYVAANKAQAEPMAEGEPEKIGGRHDPDEFDAMVNRLKKLAGSGPMKTVYDPQKRVYKNVPTAVQPQGKK